MAGCQHFVYSAEAEFGTWVEPAKAIPVETADIGTAREVIDLRVTGSCRSLFKRVLGAKSVNGQVLTYWWPSYISTLFKNWMRDNATTGESAPYTHAFLFDDEKAHLGYSIQQIANTSDEVGTSILSAYTNTLQIGLAAKEQAKLTFNFEAKDEAPFTVGEVSKYWDYGDGDTASPSMVGTPGSLYAAIARPLMFYDGTITMGGTPSITNKVISIADGTAYAKILSATITINNDLDTDGFGITEDPTRLEIWPGDREITITFEISWTDYATTFYDNARAGTDMAFELALAGPGNAEAAIVIPSVFFDPTKLPSVTGSAKKKTLSLTGKAQYDSTTGKDFNVWIKDSTESI